MTVEENKALLKRFYEEVINQGEYGNIEELLNEDFVDHNLPPVIDEEGVEGLRQAISYLRSAFPDVNLEIIDMIGEGEKLAIIIAIKGTHQGEFMGIEPTGNKIDAIIIDYMRFENGKLAERWGLYDVYNLMQQLSQKAA